MKKLLLFFLCVFYGWILQAQTTKAVDVTAGHLYASLTETERNSITTLALIGTIDARDFKFIRDKMPALTKLILTQVTIAPYEGNEGTSIDGNTVYPANKIPDYAFYDNDTLKSSFLSIQFPPNVTVIGKHAFSKSHRFGAITLSSTVQEIETGAFSHCYNLKQISIPSFNISIGDSAFYYCGSLNRITLGCRIPPDLSNSSKALTYVRPDCFLNVPYGARMNYTDNEDWDFYNIQEAATGFAAKTNAVEIRGRETSQASFIVSSTTEWTARSDQDWLIINPSTGIGLSQEITVTANANPSTTSSRKAYIELSAPGFPPQTVTVTQRARVPMKTIEIAAGGLESELTTRELDTISNLKITGIMDARDFKIMRDKMPLLTDVDLSGVTIAAYHGSEGTMNNYTMDYPASEIPDYAFVKGASENSNLQSVMLPQSLTSIGSGAFYYCIGLTNIDIPSMVTSIKQQAFYNCSGLKSVILPSSIISMESNCFAYCIKLSSITAGSSIPPDFKDSNGAFMAVDKNLCLLKVPYGSVQDYRNANEWKNFINIAEATNGFHVSTNSVKVDGIAGSTATVEINANTEWTAGTDQDWLMVNPQSGAGLSQVITFTAEANPSFTTVRTAYVTITAPWVTSQRITVMQSVHPQSPKTWEATPGGLATAFTAGELASIYDLTLTGSIDARDFKTMRDLMPLLAKVNLSGVTIVSYHGTEGTSLDGNTDYPANTIPEYAFLTKTYESGGKTTLKAIVLPESLTAIDKYSFTLCDSLTNVLLPASLTEIGSYAFFGCRSMTEIIVPQAVTAIGLNALGYFNGAINVASDNAHYMSENNVLFNKAQTELIQFPGINSGHYEISSTVTTIADYAFNNCELLTSVTIPSSVTFIGSSAFEWCPQLKSIYAHSITPVDLNASVRVFYPVDNYGCTLYVPIGSKTAYQTANQWKDFENIVEVNPHLIANAGPDKEMEEGTSCLLYGSFLVNTGGKPLTYQWTAPEGIALNAETDQYPIFTAPEVTDYTTYTFSLIVSDGLNTSTADQVTITVRNVNKPPVAHAGTDQAVNERSQVTLDGSASFDPDDNYLNYEWMGPNAIYISSRYSPQATFTAPDVLSDSSFTFFLKVNDGNSYQTDTVVITVRNINRVPVAHAGDVQMVNEGETVTLDATRSTDADGDALTYKWTAPEGITLSSLNSATPSFTVPSVESDMSYTFKLVVNDGKVNSVTSQAYVYVKNVPSILTLMTHHSKSDVPVNYHLYMYDGNAFVHKRDTFSVTGDTLRIMIEPGYWIGLVSPALDPAAFVPTWSGNVLSWDEAEVINIPVNGFGYMGISGIAPQAATTGAGRIAGFVYEKPNDGTKSISITRQENMAMNPPVQSALVQLYKKGSSIPAASVFTDEQGAYLFDKLAVADYELVVEIPGYLQSERFPVALTEIAPSTKVWFAVNPSLRVITDHPTWETSLLKVYPNPTKGVVYITGLPDSRENTISVYSMDGRTVLALQPLIEGKIDLSNQVPGIYLMMVNKERFRIIRK
ncbi:MAG TPA: leucine-rich repeat protein [Prolixibacteraceae bacterium]|nr:leucine-rich repeat protein [Prolixibacteraceae bacterium]